MRLGLLSLVIALGLFGADASAATLDRIKKSGVVKIAYRVDAAPYSYKNAIGEPSGYTVDLCRAVTASLKGQLGLQEISIEYVPVTAENRSLFWDGLNKGKRSIAIDLRSPRGQQIVTDLISAPGADIRTDVPKYRIFRDGELEAEVETIEAVDQYTLQADLFSQAIRNGGGFAFPLEDSVKNMRVIDAVYRSARSGAWEKV